MVRPTATEPSGAEFLISCWRQWPLWCATAAAGLVLAGMYVVLAPADWQATQTLVVRNEGVSNQDGPGRFRQENEMKTTQETILEVAHSRGVAQAALAAVGPPAGKPSANWPSARDVADLQDSIEVAPPKGTEFGKSEIFYLRVKDRDRGRALALVAAVCEGLERKLQSVREAKAEGLIDELAKAATLAEADLAQATERLAQIERQVGGTDLAELRMLDQYSNGDSDLRRNLTTVEAELRDARNAQQAHAELLAELTAARQNPGRLLATPNRLLESQPGLRRLKDGLVDAQLRTSQLLGNMSPAHPQVISARSAEEEIRGQVHAELGVAIRGVEVESRLTAGRIARLEAQQADIGGRLDRLAALRAEYSNLTAACRHQNTLVEKARQDLAQARGSRAAALSGSLVARVDGPGTGNRPVGPRKAAILLAGGMAGLLGGLGVVFLCMPLGGQAAHGQLAQGQLVQGHAVGDAAQAAVASASTEQPAATVAYPAVTSAPVAISHPDMTASGRAKNGYGWPELIMPGTRAGLSFQRALRKVSERA